MKKRKIKAAKADFTAEMLPQTRKEQFFFLIKNQYGTLFKLGFLFFACLFLHFASSSVEMAIDQNFYDQFQAGSITEEDYDFYLFFDNQMLMVAFLLLSPLFALATSSSHLVYRELLQGELVVYRADLKESRKENYGFDCLTIALFWLFFGITNFLALYLSLSWLAWILYALFFFLPGPVFLTMLFYHGQYEGKYGTILLNCAKIYVSHFYWALLLEAILLVPILLLEYFVPIPWLKLSIYSVLCFFLSPLVVLLGQEIHQNIFDEEINKTHYPDHYRLGLYRGKRQAKEKGRE